MKKIVLIDLLKKFTNKKNNYKYLPMLNGYTPIFSQFGNDIYASDVVQQAIVCIVDENFTSYPHLTSLIPYS